MENNEGGNKCFDVFKAEFKKYDRRKHDSKYKNIDENILKALFEGLRNNKDQANAKEILYDAMERTLKYMDVIQESSEKFIGEYNTFAENVYKMYGNNMMHPLDMFIQHKFSNTTNESTGITNYYVSKYRHGLDEIAKDYNTTTQKLIKDIKQDKNNLNYHILLELENLKEGSTTGTTGDEKAFKIAKIIDKNVDTFRVDMILDKEIRFQKKILKNLYFMHLELKDAGINVIEQYNFQKTIEDEIITLRDKLIDMSSIIKNKDDIFDVINHNLKIIAKQMIVEATPEHELVMIDIIKKNVELIRDDLIQTGLFIYKKDGYDLIHLHSREALLKMGKDEWVKTMLDGDYLDLNTMFDMDNTSVYTIEDILGNLWEDIILKDGNDKHNYDDFHSATDQSITHYGKTRSDKKRFLIFNNGKWAEYNKLINQQNGKMPYFDVDTVMHSMINENARKQSLLRTFGINPFWTLNEVIKNTNIESKHKMKLNIIPIKTSEGLQTFDLTAQYKSSVGDKFVNNTTVELKAIWNTYRNKGYTFYNFDPNLALLHLTGRLHIDDKMELKIDYKTQGSGFGTTMNILKMMQVVSKLGRVFITQWIEPITIQHHMTHRLGQKYIPFISPAKTYMKFIKNSFIGLKPNEKRIVARRLAMEVANIMPEYMYNNFFNELAKNDNEFKILIKDCDGMFKVFMKETLVNKPLKGFNTGLDKTAHAIDKILLMKRVAVGLRQETMKNTLQYFAHYLEQDFNDIIKKGASPFKFVLLDNNINADDWVKLRKAVIKDEFESALSVEALIDIDKDLYFKMAGLLQNEASKVQIQGDARTQLNLMLDSNINAKHWNNRMGAMFFGLASQFRGYFLNFLDSVYGSVIRRDDIGFLSKSYHVGMTFATYSIGAIIVEQFIDYLNGVEDNDSDESLVDRLKNKSGQEWAIDIIEKLSTSGMVKRFDQFVVRDTYNFIDDAMENGLNKYNTTKMVGTLAYSGLGAGAGGKTAFDFTKTGISMLKNTLDEEDGLTNDEKNEIFRTITNNFPMQNTPLAGNVIKRGIQLILETLIDDDINAFEKQEQNLNKYKHQSSKEWRKKLLGID